MKKISNKNILIFIGVVIITIVLFLIITDKEEYVLKSEYGVGELAQIDNIELTLKNVSYINNHSGIELTFEIKNNKDTTITITPDKYFVFYDINQVQIPNKYTNDKNIIKKKETITYKLQYDISSREIYEIYFYSQTVENNIKFSFTSNEILKDI